MKYDYELIKNILLAMEEYPEYRITQAELEKIINIDIKNKNKFIGHIFLLGDSQLIECDAKKSEYGFRYGSANDLFEENCNYRMTANGYEFLEILKNDNLYKKIKNYVLPIALEVGKELFVEFIKG